MDESAKEAGLRLAGAFRTRRIYAPGAAAAREMVAGLCSSLERALEDRPRLAVGVLADRLAIDGDVLPNAPVATDRLAEQMSRLGLEVISLSRGVRPAELEALLDLLSTPPEELRGERLDGWLRRRGVTHVEVRHLVLEKRNLPSDLRSTYRRATRELGDVFGIAARGGRLPLDTLSDLAQTLLDVALQPGLPLSSLIALEGRDDRQLVHSVNVACLVGAQARALGLEGPQVLELMTAALTHDIGKTRVPEGILQKAGPLTAAERSWLDRHTLAGGRLLLESESPLGAVVAFHHHRALAEGEAGHLAVELTKLADIFDGLRTLVPFRRRAGVRAALAWMQRHPLGTNAFLLERFARLVDAAPPGTIGQLATGETAEVVASHPELAFHPVVRIQERGDGHIPDGAVLDLALAAHRADLPSFILALPHAFEGLTELQIRDLG